jgi:hypothetical protein
VAVAVAPPPPFAPDPEATPFGGAIGVAACAPESPRCRRNAAIDSPISPSSPSSPSKDENRPFGQILESTGPFGESPQDCPRSYARHLVIPRTSNPAASEDWTCANANSNGRRMAPA